jgi:5-methylcytosine-specific restriction protein B
MIEPRLKEDLRDRYQQLFNEGALPSREQLARYYATFRSRFGPEQLRSLDGEALLTTMHDHGNRDSLVYWLEFKDDEEFPAHFGSIAGGSALKFGIYRRKETGAWMTGSPQKQVELSTEEAIEIARRHRDQLLRGAELVADLPQGADDVAYQRLQADMEREAPDVSRMAWGHKYFCLLAPKKLDDYHVEDYQRFHLIKLLQVPPEGEGRYLCAGRYVAIAGELDIHLNHLTTVLNKRDGRPHRYWRVLVNYQEKGWRNRWESMLHGGYVTLGWSKLGDLSDVTRSREGRSRIGELMKRHYGDKGGWAREVYNFVAIMEPEDLVLAFEKNTVLGIGRVTGGYTYDLADEQAPHRRTIDWISAERWELPQPEAESRTVRQLRLPINKVATERHLLTPIKPPSSVQPRTGVPPRLEGIPGRIQAILERKGQVILYGPPGTGKTYWARQTALDLAALSVFGQPYASLDEVRRADVVGDAAREGLVRICTFHPAYGYEDFIEGYRPQENSAGQLVFSLRAGLFQRMCTDAAQQPRRKFYLLIDEINRGDIPRIFGELLTLLERDKRGQALRLPLSGERFSVPSNIYVIGTMNTADRSIALLDTALRRRFGFIELMPDPSVLGNAGVGGIPLGPWLAALNTRILEHIGRDARNLQVGHAYLLEKGRPVTDFTRFVRILEEDLVPLLQEYCYEDYSALAHILGRGLVDEAKQRIRRELFAPARRDELIQALLAPAPEIAASPQAVAQDDLEEEEDELDEEDADE